MRFTVRPKPDETQRACTEMATAVLPPSRAGLIMLAVFAVFALAVFLFARPTWVITLMLTLAGVLTLFSALQAEARWRVSRAQALDSHASEPYEIEVGPDGIRAWCAHVDTRYTWDGITSVVETPEFYLFLRGPGGGLPIPKRLLDAASDDELRKMIRRWSPDRGASLAGEAVPQREPATP